MRFGSELQITSTQVCSKWSFYQALLFSLDLNVRHETIYKYEIKKSEVPHLNEALFFIPKNHDPEKVPKNHESKKVQLGNQ